MRARVRQHILPFKFCVGVIGERGGVDERENWWMRVVERMGLGGINFNFFSYFPASRDEFQLFPALSWFCGGFSGSSSL